jgi:F420-dependent oxidoreductase-like protein
MAKPFRIGTQIVGEKSVADTVAQLRSLAEAGYDHAFVTQMFDHDALTLLAAVGPQVPGIELMTGVVPIYGRHPTTLAQQALTVQSAADNRLTLGIGLSHQIVVENMWGLSYDKPARYMREYLDALMPLLRGETVTVAGERIAINTFAPIGIPDVTAPPVLVAALGDIMLGLAGRLADGTITWMTGTRTIETHISPSIRAAAEAAGRPTPRIAVALPICITTDVEATNAIIDEQSAMYPHLPAYKAMLDKEGAERASDIALVGDEATVLAGLERLASAGTTDFLAGIMGQRADREVTSAFLSQLARS